MNDFRVGEGDLDDGLGDEEFRFEGVFRRDEFRGDCEFREEDIVYFFYDYW